MPRPEPPVNKIVRNDDISKPLITHEIESANHNCCTNGSYCWYLFSLCGLCDTCGKY